MTKQEKRYLDSLWAELIKNRVEGKCEKCGLPGQNAHHLVGRRNYAVRYDLENGVYLCSGCHSLRKDSAHQNPLDFMEWLEKYKGKKFITDLKMRSNFYYKPDFKITRLYLKTELKKYERTN